MILQTIAAAFTRKPSPPSPSEAARTLSMRAQRSRDAREHEQRKAEMTARMRRQFEELVPGHQWKRSI